MRRLRRFFALVCLSPIMVLPLGAVEARSLALVIGNNTYDNVPQLQKATNDARAVGDALERIGFIVRRVENVDQRSMSKALVAFDADIQPGDRALFYYAGHGFEISGQNYLLPTDVPAAEASQEELVRDASFPVERVVDGIKARGASVAILVLDACRDNPFAPRGTRSTAQTRGLARVDPPEGVFVLMSAGAKQEALDALSNTDPNPNSVFTRTLIGELGKPGETLVQIAKKTQIGVRSLAASVSHDQTPAYYDEVIGDIVLTEEAPAGAKPAQQVADATPAADPSRTITSIPTQLNIAGDTLAGPDVKLGTGTKLGPGVVIGGKAADIAVQDPANPPKVDPTRGAIIQQGGAAIGQQVALLNPDPKVGTLGHAANGHAPIASFMRSNSGWTVTLSLPEAATSISYRLGDAGEFKETGVLDVLDQRTGQRMPNPSFQMSPKVPATIIQVRYQTADGADVGPFPIRFDPDMALYDNQKKNLEQIWPNWVEFRDFNGTLVYFTTLVTYRCAISELRYGLNGGEPLKRYDLPVCDAKNPFNIPDNAKIYMKVPDSTKSISLKITWRDGTESEVNTIEKE